MVEGQTMLGRIKDSQGRIGRFLSADLDEQILMKVGVYLRDNQGDSARRDPQALGQEIYGAVRDAYVKLYKITGENDLGKARVGLIARQDLKLGPGDLAELLAKEGINVDGIEAVTKGIKRNLTPVLSQLPFYFVEEEEDGLSNLAQELEAASRGLGLDYSASKIRSVEDAIEAYSSLIKAEAERARSSRFRSD